ncbi:DUF4435 domain-containing protein [Novosphingopyxis sp. YJ-S2-01]|uniref:DUF4435 domain-containing protein n=1 Tax=Novosphingopyxis sp. YJ-S2-01 TaxID=2794021 RepID=UPI0018DEA849|nr:DUF4435 domain-containing protein [Novosphingopyxis sp. YJ-S2-01]MBH9537571.1 DUF4435 domain-containing protein [Novosphingopyxis sp. YJ-S2-01]
MDDYAVYLAEEAKSDIVALHQFRILFDPSQESYHFFFEGEEDSLFYMPEARRHTGTKPLHIYDCGGKRNVIEVRDTIVADGYDIAGCLFFVDRDYDDFLGSQVVIDDATYITDGYSIENDISSWEAAKILLTDVVRISVADPEFARIEIAFKSAFSGFYTELRPLTGWILASKDARLSPNLNNTVGLRGIVEMSGTVPSVTKEGFARFKRAVVVNGRLPPLASILKWTRALNTDEPKLWVRGKYEIWFFQAILLAVLGEANVRRKQSGGRAIRIPSSLRDGRIFELLGGRAPPTPSLQQFYRSRLH